MIDNLDNFQVAIDIEETQMELFSELLENVDGTPPPYIWELESNCYATINILGCIC